MNEQRKDGSGQSQSGQSRQDEQSEQSFPASDPPSHTPTSGPGRTAEDHEHTTKGQPTDDRLASETASARVQGIHPPQTDHR